MEGQMSAEQFQRIGRAVADANRWEMLRLIFARPEMTCGEVLSSFSITAGTFSHHLKELEEAGLVQTTACGRFKKLTPRKDIWAAYLAELQGI